MIWDEKEIDILVEIGTISGIMDMQTSVVSFSAPEEHTLLHFREIDGDRSKEIDAIVKNAEKVL